MANVPRRRKRRKNGPAAPSSDPPRPNGASNGSATGPNGHGSSAAPPGSNGAGSGSSAAPPGDPPSPPSGSGDPPPPRCPADELEDLLVEPEEGAFLYGLDRRVYYPTLIERITETGERIVNVLRQYDSPELFLRYEALEFDIAEVRERAAFSFGWQKGSADGRAASLRAQAPHLSERAKRLADHTRALVVTEGLSVIEATALLLETAWSVLLTPPAPPYDEG
ncbi:MAG TPA: hypothetical protein VFS00_21780 [Polyangiaceae bacterium]|nr:hypothetical protein [Polyangiaceae bacterium]